MNIRQQILKESQTFVRKNKGLKLDPKKNRKAFNYLSPRISSEFMDCSMPMTFDHYSHCSLGCTYCFAYMFKTNNSSFTEKLHAVNAKNVIAVIRGKPRDTRNKAIYKHFTKKRFLLHWGGLADPFDNFEKANMIGYDIIEALAEEEYPTLFSFKGSAIFRPKFRNLFEKHSDKKNFAFQVSIIAPSDELSREIEIGVPVTSRRLDAIRMLSEMGYYTILRLRPFIIGISDKGLDELLDKALDAGISGISMEFFALDQRSNAALIRRYKWIGELIGIGQDKVMEYFKELSPSWRGGYQRLNRFVKERFVKQVYKFCLKHDLVFGCSDPDFKELNMSGSCCAMPDKYKANPELQNWTKNQLTYFLKEARKKYHQTGQIYRFRFNTVFDPEVDTYLNSVALGQDHPVVAGKPASERWKCHYLQFARDTWNNLRSPGNPQNYFDGKMLPTHTDSENNYIYKYVPMEYEDRWIKEGIDLAK